MSIFFITIGKSNGRGGGSKYFSLTSEGGVENTSDPNHEHPILPTYPCT